MNTGDCFILNIDHDIYVYVGSKARRVERLKAISVANQIRDQDHNGRAKIDIIGKNIYLNFYNNCMKSFDIKHNYCFR